MNLANWVPAAVAILAVVANAAITQAAVTRHEKVIESLREDVQELEKAVAVLNERLRSAPE